jgi:hypothetical protein
LRDLKYRTADSVPVSDADLIVRQTIDSEILSELSELKIITPEFALPISIRLDLIDHHGTLFATMTLKICLAIAIKIQSPSKNTMRYGTLQDRGTNKLALPFNFAWKTDIDGQEFRHGILDWAFQMEPFTILFIPCSESLRGAWIRSYPTIERRNGCDQPSFNGGVFPRKERR